MEVRRRTESNFSTKEFVDQFIRIPLKNGVQISTTEFLFKYCTRTDSPKSVTSDPVVSATAVFAYNRIKVFTQSLRFPIVSSNADIGVQW